MTRNLRLLIPLTLVVAALLPDTAAACERCFGAGADSATVSAIGLSMLTLLLTGGFVFTGIVRFFNQSSERSKELARRQDSTGNVGENN